MGVAGSWYTFGAPLSARASEWFVAISTCILAIQLQDVESLCLGTLSGGSC